ARESSLLASFQDAELFLLAAHSPADLIRQVDHLLTFAARVSRAELADLAAQLEKSLAQMELRAAVVASTPMDLTGRLATLKSWLVEGAVARLDFNETIFLGAAKTVPRIGFLFPGQGSPTHLDGGIFRRRFEFVRELYAQANLPAEGESTATDIAQPGLCTASLAGLRVLREFGLDASVAVGHSLGEITALHWAGVFDEAALLRIARVRGKAMAELGSPTGGMAALGAPAEQVQALLNGEPVSIVGINSRRQTVVAGEAAAGTAFAARAPARGLPAIKLPVSHAFHTPLVAAAAPVLAEQLSQERFETPQRAVVSTITGGTLQPQENLRALLCRQVTSPVKFMEALTAAAEGVDLFIEVGPGSVLTGLASDCVAPPSIALDAGGSSLKGLLTAAGAAYALGAALNHATLFRGRFTRAFNLDWKPKFFVNPCELAPAPQLQNAGCGVQNAERVTESAALRAAPSALATTPSPLELLRELVATRAELPVAAVREDSRMLGDLHLNSITVGQLVAEAARRLNLAPIAGLTDFATATVGRIAQALEELCRTGRANKPDDKGAPAGVDSWIRPFTVKWMPAKLTGSAKTLDARPGHWEIFAPPFHPLASALRERFSRCAGSGVVVCLAQSPDELDISLLLAGARAV